MDLHRLRVVEFDTLVSEEEGEKKSIAELEESKQEECKVFRSDDKKDKTNELGSDKNYVDDNINPSEISKKSSFIKRKSKSEIFGNPSITNLKKRELTINLSFEDLSTPVKDSVHSNAKKRTLNLFTRKSAGDQKRGDIKSNREGRKKKEDIHFLFARDTPSFIRYSRKRSRNEGTRNNHDFKLPNDIFGFHKNNQSVHPHLYQMSCNYLNLDKFPFKNIKKGFRRNIPPPVQGEDCFCKHHAMRVLNSRNASSGDNSETTSIYYNLSTHSHAHRARRRRDHLRHEEGRRKNVPFKMAKDKTVSVSPSSLLSIKKCCCDACVGTSKPGLPSHSQRRPPTHHDPSSSHPKPPRPRHPKPSPQQHSTPSPSCTSKAPAQKRYDVIMCDKKQTRSVVKNQRKRLFAGFIQNLTAFHSKNWPSVKSFIKFGLFGLLIVVWSPCLLAGILAWVVMCPVKLTNIIAIDKKNKSAPIMKSFMNRFRKKGPGSEYQRMRYGKHSCQKNKSFLNSVMSWYARAAGTVVNSFRAMSSLLKVSNNAPTCGAGSSFLTSTHPNPKRRYTLYYADNRGWMMKPARRSQTRSCASTRVVQSMRCEFRPKFWQKSTHCQKCCQTKMGQSSRNVNCGCPVRGVHPYFKSNTARQLLSPAGDATCACPEKISYSGKRILLSKLNIGRKYRKASAMLIPAASHRLPRQQVNISPKNILETSGIASNSSKNPRVKTKPKNPNSSQIAEISQKLYPKYQLTQRKNGTLPYGIVFDCPCGTKHPLITNREMYRTHNFSLAGKTLNMTTKHTPKYKNKGLQEQYTKYGPLNSSCPKHGPSTINRKSPGTNRTALTDKTKSLRSKNTPSYESNGSQGQSTKYKIALNCPCGTKRKPSITDRKLHRTLKSDYTDKTRKQITTYRETPRTRNRAVLADLSKSALTKHVETSTYKIDLTDKITSINTLGSSAANVECACKYTIYDKTVRAEKFALDKKLIECGCRTERQPSARDKVLNCPCVFTHQPGKMDIGTLGADKTDLAHKKHPANKQANYFKKQSPRIEKALHCNESGTTHAKTVRAEQSASDKKLIESGCGTESITVAASPTRNQDNIALKHVPPVQRTTEYTCKTVQKKLIDYSCGIESQSSTAVAKILSKQQADRRIEKASKYEQSTIRKDMSSFNQSPSTKNTIGTNMIGTKSVEYRVDLNCPCASKHQSSTVFRDKVHSLANETLCNSSIKFSQKLKISDGQSYESKIALNCPCGVQHQATAIKCGCKYAPSTIQKEVVRPKQSVSVKKAIACGCGTENQQSTADKVIDCPCGAILHTRPSVLKKVTTEGRDPLYKTGFTDKPKLNLSKKAISSQAQPASTVDSKILPNNRSVYADIPQTELSKQVPRQQCTSIGLASDSVCEKNQEIAVDDNKTLCTRKTSFAEHGPSQQPKFSQAQSQTSQQFPSPVFGIASDCACKMYKPIPINENDYKTRFTDVPGQQIKHSKEQSQSLGTASDYPCETFQPIAIEKNSSYTDKSGLTEYPIGQQIKSTQKQLPTIGIASECPCQTDELFSINKNTGLTGQPPSHLVKLSQPHTHTTQKQAIASDCPCQMYVSVATDETSTTDIIGLADQRLGKQTKFSQTPSKQKKCPAFTDRHKTDLGKHTFRRHTKSTRSQTSQKRSSIKIGSEMNKKNHYIRQTSSKERSSSKGEKASQTKTHTSHQASQYEQNIKSCKKRAIDCIHRRKKHLSMIRESPTKYRSGQVKSPCKQSHFKKSSVSSKTDVKSHHHHTLNPCLSERTSIPRTYAPKNPIPSLERMSKCCSCCKSKIKQSSSFERAHKCTCSSIRSSKSVLFRPTTIPKPSKGPSSQNSCRDIEYTYSVKKNHFPSVKSYRALAGKSRYRLLGHVINKRPLVSKLRFLPRHLLSISGSCHCSHEEKTPLLAKTDIKDSSTARQSSIRSLDTTKSVYSVNPPSSSQPPPSSILRNSSKVSRLVMKLHSKLFSRKISKQTKIPAQSPIPMYSSLSKNPCDNNSSHCESIQENKSHRSSSRSSISQSVYSSQSKKPSSARLNPQKTSTSIHSRKSILVDKSYQSLSRHSQKSKTSHHPSCRIYSSHSMCRCPVQSTTSKFSSDKNSFYVRRPILVHKSHSRISRRSISRQSKTSQRSSFPSYLNLMECLCSVDDTSQHSISNTSCKCMVNKFYPELSQRNLSQQSKPSHHSSIVMTLFPIKCTCSITETSSTQNNEKLNHLGKKSQLKPNQLNKMCQFSSLFRRSQLKHSAQKYSNNSQASPRRTQQKLDSQSLLGQQPTLTQNPLRLDNNQATFTISVEKHRIHSDPVSHIPRNTTLEKETQPGLSQHHKSQQPNISKYSRYFNSQPTSSVDRQRLISNPVSHLPTPAHSQHQPNQHHEISKTTRYFFSHPTPSTEIQWLSSDPVSHHPRKKTIGTDGPPAYPQHLRTQQPDISKYSPHLSSEPVPSIAEQRFISDPGSQDPHKTTTGTDALVGIPHHRSSQQPEISKYARHFSSELTPSAENQQSPSDPMAHHPRKITMGTDEQPGFPDHEPKQEPQISKRSSFFNRSQSKPLAEKLRVLSDKISLQSRKNGQEKKSTSQYVQTPPIIPGKCNCLSEKLHKLSERISQYSHRPISDKKSPPGLLAHVDSPQQTPSLEKKRLQSDPHPHHLRKITIGTEGSPVPSQHHPSQQPDVSKRSSPDRHSQPKYFTEKLRKLSDIVSQQLPKPEQEKISQHKQHNPNLRYEMSKRPHPLNPPRPIIPKIPGSCTCTVKQCLQLEYTRKTALDNKSQQNIDLKHLPNEQHETPDLHILQPSPAEKLRLLSDPVPQHPRKTTLGNEALPKLPSQDPKTSEYSRHISSQPTASAVKLRHLSDPASQHLRKKTFGNEVLPGYPHHFSSEHPELSGYSPHQPTPIAEKEHVHPDSVWHSPRKTALGTEGPPAHPQHLPSQHREISEYSPLLRCSQPTPSVDKQQLLSDPVSHLPRKATKETETQPEFSQHLPSQQHDISKRSSRSHRSQSKRVTEKVQNTSDSLFDIKIPKSEQKKLSQQKQSPNYPYQETSKHPHSLDPLQTIPIIPGKCTCTEKQRLQSDISRKTTLDKKSQQNIDLHHCPGHQPDTTENSPHLHNQPIASANKQRRLSDAVTQHPHKSTIGTEEQSEFPQHLANHQPDSSEYTLHLNFQTTSSAEKQQLPSDPVSNHPRKTSIGTKAFAKFPHHLPNLEPNTSKHLRHYSYQPSIDKQGFPSDPALHVPLKTPLRTEGQPRFSHHFQQSEGSHTSPFLHISQPTHVISGACTSSINNQRIPQEIVLYNLQNTSSECKLSEMSNRLPSSHHFQQSHSITSDMCTYFTNKKLSPDKVSDYSFKKVQVKKHLGMSQHVTDQRTETDQSPPSPLSKRMSAVFSPNACACKNNQLQTLKKKLSHVSREQTLTATVDKPPPGLLQRSSSGQVRKGSAGKGQQQVLQPAITSKQSPYPDFNRVSIRYPGLISKEIPGSIHSELIPARRPSERIPAPANHNYPPALGVSPPPNYARLPCYINPANTCYDESALRRAYKRRPLRYIPPKQQLKKMPKPKIKKKEEETKKMKEEAKKNKEETNKKKEESKKKKEEPKKKKEEPKKKREEKKKKKEEKKKKKKKRMKSGGKLTQCCRCVKNLVYEAEKEAWPANVTSCSPMYIHILKRRPCFWIFECCPSIYPTFLNCLKFQANICQMCMYLLSICFWCPLIFCVYFCCDIICGS